MLSSDASASGAGDGPVGAEGPGGGAVTRADDRRRREDVGRVVDWDTMLDEAVEKELPPTKRFRGDELVGADDIR